MPDLRELYQEVVVDHSRRPRNFRRIEEPSCSARGYNPLCGDKVSVYVKLQDGRLADVSFEGSGCAISTASASMMTEVVKGKTVEETGALFEGFHRLVTTGEASSPRIPLGKLAVFSNVSDYPARVKCATLVWHTLRSALEGREALVSTE
jgi:nitrogen fixation protein NifU and related proteins